MGENSNKQVIESILNSAPEYIQKIKNDITVGTKPFKCAVIPCANVYDRNYTGKAENFFKFHKFPASLTMRQQWTEKCGLAKNADVSAKMVCSEHFNLDDYERNYREEFCRPNYRRPLKTEAVPSLKLTGPAVEINEDELQEAEINTVEVLSKGRNKRVKKTGGNAAKKMKPKAEENTTNESRVEGLCEVERDPEAERKEAELKERLQSLKSEIAKANCSLYYYNRQIEKLQAETNTRHTGKPTGLHRVFSEAQIDVLRGKDKVVWSDDDLAMAFTLRHMSNRECYLYLKHTLNMPLPALSAVQKWAAFKN